MTHLLQRHSEFSLLIQYQDSMRKEDLENIIKEQGNLKNLPNNDLVSFLESLTDEFELTKTNLINLTIYLDKIEELYNNVLKEYDNRAK